MGVVVRGFKNAFRNGIRTLSIVLILAISIAMSLVMLLALKTVDGKIATVKSSVGNIITVSPAGVRGFEGGGELLTEQNATDIKAIVHVAKVTEVVQDHLASDNTSLTPAIEPGSFGNRQRSMESESASNDAPKAFAMPVMITGTNDLASTAALAVDKMEIKSGEKIDATSSDIVAMMGTDLATKNNLNVGSTFTAYGKDIKLVGIFDSGNKFANGSFVMPIKALQSISGQNNQINSIIVTTDAVDQVSDVTAAIKTKLGDKADVVSSQDSSQSAIEPLENIKTISLYSLIGSLVAGSVIILLTMVMIVRERRREIGVLKAIGSSNINVVGQFISEAMTLTLSGAAIGIILGTIFSNPVLKVLISNSQSEIAGPGSGGPGQMMRGGMMGVQNAIGNLHAVVGWDIILYGLLAAIAIATIGSAIPAFFISKVRPAEVMRQE